MTRELRTVARVAARRRAADTAYRAALHAARRAGASLPEIAAAAGVTKAAVWNTIHRHPEGG